jgi:hypothetical protein
MDDDHDHAGLDYIYIDMWESIKSIVIQTIPLLDSNGAFHPMMITHTSNIFIFHIRVRYMIDETR